MVFAIPFRMTLSLILSHFKFSPDFFDRVLGNLIDRRLSQTFESPSKIGGLLMIN